jgi:hypothetical protein
MVRRGVREVGPNVCIGERESNGEEQENMGIKTIVFVGKG